MRRLLLVRHAPTAATRAAAFPADESLDERAVAEAAALSAALPTRFEALTSTAVRCRETAEAAGLDARPTAELNACDFGAWTGRTLASVDDEDPDSVAAWMRDPEASPHGGESLATLGRRVDAWVDEQAEAEGTLVAITHGEVVKTALVHVLGAPREAFWRIDVAPLSVTELHGHDRRWTVVRTNCPLREASAE